MKVGKVFLNSDGDKLMLKQDILNKNVMGVFSFLKDDGSEKIGSDLGFLHDDFKNKVMTTRALFKNLKEIK